jgi:hypothetical protein
MGVKVVGAENEGTDRESRGSERAVRSAHSRVMGINDKPD